MSLPNLKEIEWAISELESEESSKSGYILLAALYTCRNELLGVPAQPMAYAEAAEPPQTLRQYGDSEFLNTIVGKDPAAAWAIMDDLMESLRVVNLRVYNSVMRKIQNL